MDAMATMATIAKKISIARSSILTAPYEIEWISGLDRPDGEIAAEIVGKRYPDGPGLLGASPMPSIDAMAASEAGGAALLGSEREIIHLATHRHTWPWFAMRHDILGT